MPFHLTILGASLAACVFASSAYAGNAAQPVQRDVNQQERIERGLKSGELSTKEAGRLEKEESRVDRMESKALKDGKMTRSEQNRINAAQDKVSRDIYDEKHDAQKGNPDSASSQRMQADVQRNANQEQRLEKGLQNGSLTDREAARLERGQARTERKEGNAASDGHVGAEEQRRIQAAENRQSGHIHRQKHDTQHN